MSRLILLALFLGACSPKDSNAPLDSSDSSDSRVDAAQADTGTDEEVGPRLPTYFVGLQSDRIAVGATQVVTVSKDGVRVVDGIEWSVAGGSTEVSPFHFLGVSVGPVELTGVVDGDSFQATFEVVQPRWKSLSAGIQTTCLLDSEDEAHCMGHLGNEKLSKLKRIPGGHKFQEISTGASFACGISSGDVYCWGDNINGRLGGGEDVHWTTEPIAVLVGEEVQEISAGMGFACASSSSKSWCWGVSSYGQVLRSPRWAEYQPLETRTHYSQIAVGHYHACGIKDDGVAACWGGNFTRQISNTPNYEYRSPQDVSEPHQYVSIHPGRFHTCARGSDGSLTCWGEGAYLNKNPPYSYLPVDTGRSFESVSVNGIFTCGLDASNLLDCRSVGNGLGVLGVGDTKDQEAWTRVPGHWWKYDGANLHACALDLEGELFCWGTNYSGSVGQPLTPILDVPTELPDIDVDDIVFSEGAICWLESGLVACRGESTNGQLGANAESPSVGVFALLPAKTYTKIFARGRTVCALTDDGDLYCWGINSGFGFDMIGRPTKVPLPSPVRDVYLSEDKYHVVAHTDGSHRYWNGQGAAITYPNLFGAWGATRDVQVHNNTRVVLDELNQVQCAGDLCADAPDNVLSEVKSVHLLDDILCALDDAGVLRCVREINATAKWVVEEWPEIFTSASHDGRTLCALDSVGVVCMGTNRFQTQLESPEIESAPLHRIPGTQGTTAVKVGHNNVCAKIAQKWMCWGDNGAGQLTRTELVFPSPTAVSL